MQSERHMNKKSKDDKTDDLRPEFDLRELLKDGVQGKYADRFQEGTNLVLLDSDVAEAFPNLFNFCVIKSQAVCHHRYAAQRHGQGSQNRMKLS